MSKTLIKAFTDKAGTAISLSNATVDGALLQNKTISDLTIPNGFGAMNHNATVSTGATLTVETNADYSVVGSLDNNGTIDNSGTITIL